MNIDQKNELVKATAYHLEMDMLIFGIYGNGESGADFKGCPAGCLAADHDVFDVNKLYAFVAHYYDIPQWLVQLQDYLFSQLRLVTVPAQIAQAIQPREHWTPVMHAIHSRILSEIVLPVAGESERVVSDVIELHNKNEPADSTWLAAESAANTAADLAWSIAGPAWKAAEPTKIAMTGWSAWSAAKTAAESSKAVLQPAELLSLSVKPAVSFARSATMTAARTASWAATKSEKEAVEKAERAVVNEKILSIVKDEIG